MQPLFRRSRTSLPHTAIVSAKSHNEAALGDGETKAEKKKHHKHGHKHGHKNHHKHTHNSQGAQGTHQKASVKLSDITERDTSETPPKSPEQKNHSEVAVNVDEVDMVKIPSSLSLSLPDSAYQSYSSLPSLADVEPSSPTVDTHFAVHIGAECAVSYTINDKDVYDITM